MFVTSQLAPSHAYSFIFEIIDIFKFPPEFFNINNYSNGTTTRSSGVKLIHNSSTTNQKIKEITIL